MENEGSVAIETGIKATVTKGKKKAAAKGTNEKRAKKAAAKKEPKKAAKKSPQRDAPAQPRGFKSEEAAKRVDQAHKSLAKRFPGLSAKDREQYLAEVGAGRYMALQKFEG